MIDPKLLTREEKLKMLNDVQKGKADLDVYDNDAKILAWQFINGENSICMSDDPEAQGMPDAIETTLPFWLVRVIKKTGKPIVIS